MEARLVSLQALFKSARTTPDGGWNVSFDTHEGMATSVTEIAKLKDQALYIVVMTEDEFHAQGGSIG